MKISGLIKFLVLILLVAFATSCGLKKKTQYSNTTGWKYNDPKSTDFTVKENYKPQTPTGMIPVEGGVFIVGDKNEVLTAPRNNPRRKITVSSFYMDEYEISNVNWREYTNWMDLVFGKTAPNLVEKTRPDGKVWREPLAYNEPYLEYYFTHPAYNDYPVVGVSWDQAVDYCQWRTDRVNELALVRAGVIAMPNYASLKNQSSLDSIANNFVFNTKKYLYQNRKNYTPTPGKDVKKGVGGEPRRVDMSDGILFADYRLPTEAEWEYAAYGLIAKGKEGLVPDGKIYPWSGPDVREHSKGNYRGAFQANFVRGRGDMMGTAGNLNDKATIPGPVDSYAPNDYGLYNMAGNVNEWVLDTYRSTSFKDASEYNSFRGNAYKTYVATSKDETGNWIMKVDSMGRIATVVQDGDDLRGFHDGDETTQLNTDFPLYADPEGMKALGNREKLDPTDILAPKISDNTRVYKGGGWRDRAYWLNPSTRRFLDENKSANDIGFRCAMSMIGDVANQNIKKRK